MVQKLIVAFSQSIILYHKISHLILYIIYFTIVLESIDVII